MSYDIYFVKDNQTCEMDIDAPAGGTFQLGGTNEAWLNITFNYAKVYAKYNFGIISHDEEGEEFLNGKTAAECKAILEKVIPKLGDDRSNDYWEATEGNAKAALMKLLKIVENVPQDAVCAVSA